MRLRDDSTTPKDHQAEIDRLRDELAEANAALVSVEEAASGIFVDLAKEFLHASALTYVCEGMRELLVHSGVAVPEGFLRAINRTKELHDLEVLKVVVGLVDKMRQFSSKDQKVSDAEMLQRAISAFSKPTGTDDLVTVHMAAKIQEAVALVESAARTKQAQAGARKKGENDPVQKAKRQVRELWDERRAGKHPMLRTNEQLALEAMRRWPILKSPKVICGWCTAWNKEVKRAPASLAHWTAYQLVGQYACAEALPPVSPFNVCDRSIQ